MYKSTIENEALALYYCVVQCAGYLDTGKLFIVISDHNPLIWFKNININNKNLGAKSLILSGYNFSVIYCKVKHNVVPDVLSRTGNNNINNNNNVYVIHEENQEYRH